MKLLTLLSLIFILPLSMLAQHRDTILTKSYNIVLNTPNGNIHGTITMPDDSNVKIPVVLIIPGSGTTDRNGNSRVSHVYSNAYKLLAEAFAQQGIASLRYDKRGVGQSYGAQYNRTLLFDDYVNDAEAWANYLKMEPRFSEVIVLGHGEGSLIGMIVANRTKLAAFIGISVESRRADKIWHSLIEKADLSKKQKADSKAVIDSLMAGKTVSDLDTLLYGYLHPQIQPFLVSWMKFDPLLEMSRLTIPAIIIHGKHDTYNQWKNAVRLAKENEQAKLALIDGMNYVLKNTGGDAELEKRSHISLNMPLHPKLPDIIVGFIHGL